MQSLRLALTESELRAIEVIFDGAKEVRLAGDRVEHRIVDPRALVANVLGCEDIAQRFVERLARRSIIRVVFFNDCGGERQPVYEVDVCRLVDACDQIVVMPDGPFEREERAVMDRIAQLRAEIEDHDREISSLTGMLLSERARKETAEKAVGRLETLLREIDILRRKVGEAIR